MENVKDLPISDENAQPPEDKTASHASPLKSEVVENKVMPILVNERGIVQAKDNSELLRYCGAMISSAMVPDRFQNPTELFGALMFVRSLNLPDTSIRQVAVIHGTPSIFGDLPLALVQKTDKMQNFKEQWFDKDYNVICFENKNLDAEVFGAVCFASRDMGDVQSFSFTLDDAKTAGLYPCSNAHKPWAKYTKMMLRYRARSIMVKSLFADLINGVSIGEYDHHETVESIKDVTPQKDTDELKNAFKQEA